MAYCIPDKKVLITGATGFIGRNLRKVLDENGIACRAALRTANRNVDGDTVVVGEIDSTTDWSRALTDVSVVVHCAAMVHVLQPDAAEHSLADFRRVNVAGSENLARQAAAAGVRRFVYLSTIKVNGEETRDTPFTWRDAPNPTDFYAISKYEAEKALLVQTAAADGMELVIIRPPLVYGRGAAGNFARLVELVRKGRPLPLGMIHNKRSLISVENLCDLILTCLAHPAAAGKVLLAADGQDLSTRRLVELLALSCGTRARLLSVPVWLLRLGGRLIGKSGEIARLTGDLRVAGSETERLLGWTPPLSPEQGIERSVS